jgi:hypothetical protein
VNHLRSTSTYTSYFILLLFVTKYYKSAVHVGGDSVKSDQTFIEHCLFYFSAIFLLTVVKQQKTSLKNNKKLKK